jgi:hypothetical protein
VLALGGWDGIEALDRSALLAASAALPAAPAPDSVETLPPRRAVAS